MSQRAKWNRISRWRIKNGYKPVKNCTLAFREWTILNFITNELGGPNGNIESSLNAGLYPYLRHGRNYREVR